MLLFVLAVSLSQVYNTRFVIDIGSNSDRCMIPDNLRLSSNIPIEILSSNVEIKSDQEYLALNISVI